MQRISSSLRAVAAAFAVAAVVVVFAASSASATSAASSRSGFAFFARDISGAPAGSVTLVGAGAFDVSSGFSHSGGLFRCAETVGQGPLAGCQAGQVGRWSTDSLLASTGFKCTGDPAEALKTAHRRSADGRAARQLLPGRRREPAVVRRQRHRRRERHRARHRWRAERLGAGCGVHERNRALQPLNPRVPTRTVLAAPTVARRAPGRAR